MSTQAKTDKRADTTTAIARKLGLENIGCEELAGNYRAFRFWWVPSTGMTRLYGQSKATVYNATQRDLLAWVLSRA